MKSWVISANEPDCGFPLQNLPFCAFRQSVSEVHLGVGIGSLILDLHRASAAGLLKDQESKVIQACQSSHLNGLMSCGEEACCSLRKTLMDLLISSAPPETQDSLSEFLIPQADVTFCSPVLVQNYTDFYASIEHATNVGRLFRPDQPLLPNYVHIPIAYHGRASSIVRSGEPIYRPFGQLKSPADPEPRYAPSAQLDYELEIGAYIGIQNELGRPVPIRSAESHIFGFCLLNDWSARDIQSWEYQPLGPFLGKNFGTTISPWVIVRDALAPYRVPRVERSREHPQPLAYLNDGSPETLSAIDMTLEVYLQTAAMKASITEPYLVSRGNLSKLFWSFAQMVAHHTSNGCNLQIGDLLGSGTVSGSDTGSEGSLLERTHRGKDRIELPTGESRAFLEDGDEIILRGYCARPDLPRISLGECRGIIHPPRS